MRYFYRAHTTPDAVLAVANRYFASRGMTAERGSGDHARYMAPFGTVDVNVEIEGGHYTRVTMSMRDVTESEIDKVAKRFLTELHATEEPHHQLRGAY